MTPSSSKTGAVSKCGLLEVTWKCLFCLRFNVFHSSLCGAVFWICYWTVFGSTPVAGLLLTSPAQHQDCPHFSLCPLHHHSTALQASRLEEKEAGKGHSQESFPKLNIPQHIMSCSASKKKGGWSSKAAIAQRLAGHHSAQEGWWVIAFASLGLFSFLLSLNYLHLDPWVFSLLPFLCFPCPTGSWLGPELLSGSTHCKDAGKLTTLRENWRPNEHGVVLDFCLTMYICLLIVLTPQLKVAS